MLCAMTEVNVTLQFCNSYLKSAFFHNTSAKSQNFPFDRLGYDEPEVIRIYIISAQYGNIVFTK